MRTNLPVTQREFDFPAEATLMSATDADSHITYANEAFINVSGFERDAITGEAHHIVRHPDMPTQAFADMWQTLKSGLSWTALVKNRRHNGDHYWVRANATPVMHAGEIAGYLSVRTKPGRDEVAAAEALYSDFRENRAGRRRFRQGLVVRTGLWAWTSLLQTMPVRWRIRTGALLAWGLTLAAASACGLPPNMLGAFAAASAVIAALATYWLNAQISKPLQTVLEQALAVAAGKLNENVHLNRIDEIGMILRAINQAGLNLRSLGDDVSEQLAGLEQVSADIAAGNQRLNERSVQSTQALGETTTAMQHMTSAVQENADTARDASALAASASRAAEQGHQVVSNVVTTMQDITQASQKIGEIISTIEGIAFQTNILALNAAVEAARAGDRGRGFAVVASEVRALAQRSATAAKEIAHLIHDSVEKTASGSKLVGKAGDAMQRILSQVEHVAKRIDEISTATTVQLERIAEVNDAVAQLDTMTQQNNELVQESTGTADQLRERTGRLIQAVAVFR